MLQLTGWRPGLLAAGRAGLGEVVPGGGPVGRGRHPPVWQREAEEEEGTKVPIVWFRGYCGTYTLLLGPPHSFPASQEAPGWGEPSTCSHPKLAVAALVTRACSSSRTDVKLPWGRGTKTLEGRPCRCREQAEAADRARTSSSHFTTQAEVSHKGAAGQEPGSAGFSRPLFLRRAESAARVYRHLFSCGYGGMLFFYSLRECMKCYPCISGPQLV